MTNSIFRDNPTMELFVALHLFF